MAGFESVISMCEAKMIICQTLEMYAYHMLLVNTSHKFSHESIGYFTHVKMLTTCQSVLPLKCE